MSDQHVDDLLPGYSVDGLTPEQNALIERHLATCERCRSRLASLRTTAALLGQLPTPRLPRSFVLTLPAVAPRPTPINWALPLSFLAAAAVLLLAFSITLRAGSATTVASSAAPARIGVAAQPNLDAVPVNTTSAAENGAQNASVPQRDTVAVTTTQSAVALAAAPAAARPAQAQGAAVATTQSESTTTASTTSTTTTTEQAAVIAKAATATSVATEQTHVLATASPTPQPISSFPYRPIAIALAAAAAVCVVLALLALLSVVRRSRSLKAR